MHSLKACSPCGKKHTSTKIYLNQSQSGKENRTNGEGRKQKNSQPDLSIISSGQFCCLFLLYLFYSHIFIYVFFLAWLKFYADRFMRCQRKWTTYIKLHIIISVCSLHCMRYRSQTITKIMRNKVSFHIVLIVEFGYVHERQNNSIHS